MEFEIYQYLILVLAAFFGGFVDSIAGGGGLISLPILMAVGMPPHLALGTNKLQGSLGTLMAATKFTLKGMVNYKEILIGIIFTLIGAMLGSYVVLFINAKFLYYIVPVIMITIFIYTLTSPTLGDGDGIAKIDPKNFYLSFGLILGFYDGFFGPGAGSFWMFAMIYFLGISMKNAVANTKVLNLTSNIVAFSIFAIKGEVLFKVGIIMGIGSLIGAYLGSNMVIKKDIKFIKTIFLSVVAVTILKLIYDILFKQ